MVSSCPGRSGVPPVRCRIVGLQGYGRFLGRTRQFDPDPSPDRHPITANVHRSSDKFPGHYPARFPAQPARLHLQRPSSSLTSQGKNVVRMSMTMYSGRLAVASRPAGLPTHAGLTMHVNAHCGHDELSIHAVPFGAHHAAPALWGSIDRNTSSLLLRRSGHSRTYGHGYDRMSAVVTCRAFGSRCRVRADYVISPGASFRYTDPHFFGLGLHRIGVRPRLPGVGIPGLADR